MGEAVGHGKVILFGEHAVVHGCPALAMALGRGARATAEPSDVDCLEVEPFGTRLWLDRPADGPHAQLQEAFALALDDVPTDRPPLRVAARLEVPAGAGLGASAALSVAIARAIDGALGRSRTEAQIAETSLRWERVFHGNPSGVDSAMAASGGVAQFVRGQPLQPVTVPGPLPLVVGHSGQAPSTRAMVQSVERQLQAEPDNVRGIFADIETIVVDGRSALERGDLGRLGQLMTRNQQLLDRLSLSTTRLEEMCRATIGAGALGAKLTGGGGGGCMIALAADFAAAEGIAAHLRDEFDAEAFLASPPPAAPATDSAAP